MKIFGLAFALVFGTTAHAADIASGMLNETTPVIYLTGEIKLEDSERFRNVAESLPHAHVVLSSPGGSLLAGVEIGSIIHSRGFSTVVAAGAECASSCGLAWLGGKERVLIKGGTVGFHAAYDARTSIESGPGNAIVGGYLRGLGFSYEAMAFVTVARPDDMLWLTAKDDSAAGFARKLGIEYKVLASLPTSGIAPQLGQGSPAARQTLAALDEAWNAHEKKDYGRALVIFRDHANKGVALAQYAVAHMLQGGQGGPPNLTEAAEWYGLAAEQGHELAQYNLGLMYVRGQGVKQDEARGLALFLRAAEQGYPPAQYNVALQYDRGIGTKQNKTEALRWYRRAAEQNSSNAQLNLGFAYSNGSGVGQDLDEAIKWYRRSADLGNAMAQFNLGQLYFEGKGTVKQSPALAAIWYRRAAEQGHVAAQINLGAMMFQGQGMPRDYEGARRWFLRAAEQGDPAAQTKIGLMYSQGLGGRVDQVTGYMWLSLAAQSGDKDRVIIRDSRGQKMTPAQRREAERLVREWRPKPDKAATHQKGESGS